MSLPVLLCAAHVASAAVITEEYTGSQDVWMGDSFLFDFDLWYGNSWPVNDTAPGLKLTTDGVGAFGAWSAADLYIDFASWDPEKETAQIDLDAWTFRLMGTPLGSADVLFKDITFSRPYNGSNVFLASYSLTQPQVNLLDNYGGGTLRLTATRNGTSDNDFTITRVGLRATTGAATLPTRVGEPSIIALLFAGLLGVVLLAVKWPRRMVFAGA